jgi:hypothetical protein
MFGFAWSASAAPTAMMSSMMSPLMFALVRPPGL